jgi:hypothetical protein
VRRQALDRERPGDTDLAPVLVRLVIEQFDIGGPCDRLVDLLLPGDVAAPACAPLQPMSAAPVPIKRGRGRPPGSRTKKAA